MYDIEVKVYDKNGQEVAGAKISGGKVCWPIYGVSVLVAQGCSLESVLQETNSAPADRVD